MIIGLDFDGTIVEHAYPEIGPSVPGALEIIDKWQNAGHKLILFTMRSKDTLEQAVDYLTKNGIKLFGVNVNPTQHSWTSSPKAYCQLYVDDASLGCPLIPGKHTDRPMVDWVIINKLFVDRFGD